MERGRQPFHAHGCFLMAQTAPHPHQHPSIPSNQPTINPSPCIQICSSKATAVRCTGQGA
eukprot:359192-Chlamydomonas_euryale.AAC.6